MSSFVEQKQVNDDDCAICASPLKSEEKAVLKLPCGHMFHNDCLDDLCEHNKIYDIIRCPNCRKPLDREDVCNTVSAFRRKELDNPEDLPGEVFSIYKNQKGGKNKRKSKSTTKKQSKLKKGKKSNKQNKTKKEKKKSIKNKKRRMTRQ